MKLRTNRVIMMITALGLALLLWYRVGAEERTEMVVSVPLEYRNIPKGYEILSTGDLVTRVNVWIRGNTANIKDLQPSEISVWLDLRNTKSGQVAYEISTDNVQLPYGLAVLRISPASINLNIEKIVRKMVQVQPYLTGSPAEGFAVSQSSVVPPQVEIVGPKSAVDSVRQAFTDPINVSGMKGTYVLNARVNVNNASARLGSTREVRVSLRIAEILDVRSFGHVRLTIEHVPHGSNVRYNPKVVKVDLQAPKALLEELDPKTIRAVLDLKGFEPGVYELTPTVVVDVPEKDKIGVAEVTPLRIHVRIS
jgi:YbbR domain-containing protein